MTDCQTRSEFLVRASRLGIDPVTMLDICQTHSRGLGLGEWTALPIEGQDEVIADLLDRIEMLHRAGLVLVDASRLHELERDQRTLQHLGVLAIERMQQTL